MLDAMPHNAQGNTFKCKLQICNTSMVACLQKFCGDEAEECNDPASPQEGQPQPSSQSAEHDSIPDGPLSKVSHLRAVITFIFVSISRFSACIQVLVSAIEITFM